MHASPQTLSRRLALGFTLIELMIAVVIVAILASVAYPAYTDYITRGRIPDATSGLSTWQIKMEQYFQDNRSYLNGAACGVAVPTATTNFVFSCDNPAPTTATYRLKATGRNSMTGFIFSIDQDSVRRTEGVRSGWTLPTANCWTSGKNGGC